MLTNLDDFPIHQTSEPMRHAATSDRNFYDRDYVNVFSKNGDYMFIVGLGCYVNLGVMDAFILVMNIFSKAIATSSVGTFKNPSKSLCTE